MPEKRDHLLLHLIVLIWGFTAVIGRLTSIDAVALVLHRTSWAALLLGLFMYAARKSFDVPRKDLGYILGTGAIIAAHWILFFAAAKVANISVCLAGVATNSLWTSLLEPLINRRPIKWYEIGLGLLMIVGLYVIFLFEFNHIIGGIMAVASAFFGALFGVINGRFIRKHSHYAITFYEMIGAALSILLLIPFYPYISGGDSFDVVPQGWDWMLILVLAGVCTVYAYTLSVKLMKKFSVFAINLTVNLEPVYGIILAFMIFGESEKMTGGFYLGTLIILLAVLAYPYLDRMYLRRQERKRLRKQNLATAAVEMPH
ncbi:DMT family transporter [Eisenibacter elegans]|jgi:drug/metabolite transporter (DMT)-like permease|uniref:DMT family transporter n=1 Tax=Eisenibacter elegans TaxID=997 RepID=UPI00047B42D6|nr:EamA family transporter [Eisenibacter elegans]